MFHETAGAAVLELARVYIAPDGKEHGTKAFARRVCPHKSDSQAYTRVVNCCNPTTNDKFDDDEWRAIIRIGYEQGRHFVAEFFVGVEYQLVPANPSEITKRARKAERRALRARLAQLEEEDD